MMMRCVPITDVVLRITRPLADIYLCDYFTIYIEHSILFTTLYLFIILFQQSLDWFHLPFNTKLSITQELVKSTIKRQIDVSDKRKRNYGSINLTLTSI